MTKPASIASSDGRKSGYESAGYGASVKTGATGWPYSKSVRARVAPGGRVVGCDFSEPMLELARRKSGEEGLPVELTRLPLVESCFNIDAYSKVGAAGIWQFMPKTGRQYGLTSNAVIDERSDPEKATRAAATSAIAEATCCLAFTSWPRMSGPRSARIPTCSRAGSIWWNGSVPSSARARPARRRTGDDGRSASRARKVRHSRTGSISRDRSASSQFMKLTDRPLAHYRPTGACAGTAVAAPVVVVAGAGAAAGPMAGSGTLFSCRSDGGIGLTWKRWRSSPTAARGIATLRHSISRLLAASTRYCA